MLPMNAMLLILLPLILSIVLHNYFAMPSGDDPIRDSNILLLIAHPDDEAMFFSPTLMALTRPRCANKVQILCLSEGNAVGLGSIRRRELLDSASRLGIPGNRVTILNDPVRFPDSMSSHWGEADLLDVLSQFASEVDIILTFDKKGVSGHRNHRSLFDGAHVFLRKGLGKKTLQLYSLVTTNVLRKYSAFLDVLSTRLAASFADKERLIFANGWDQYMIARDAMAHAHKSQMLWFRWGWITLGRYMYVNDIQRIDIVSE